MKPALAVLALALCLSAVTAAVQEAAAPGDEHAWLQQLVGTWEVSAGVPAEPGGEAMTWKGTETVRSLGGLWIVAEGSADFGDESFGSLLTLGYDPARKAFVGTWVDTMQTHLWTYVGSLDEVRKVLTLETEGPGFDDETTTSRYRDAIELVDSDHKRLTSSVLGEDGTWTTFLTADYRRK